MVKRLNSTNEGWQGNEYHYTGRDKINYIARTNSLGNWEYRATNGPSTWQTMPKGYQTTGGFKFDNNSAWNRRTNENSYANQANENIRKISKNADQLTKARQRANRNVRTPFVNNTADLQSALWYAGAFNGLKDRHGRDVTYETATDGIRGDVTNRAIQNAVNMGYNVDINRGTITRKQNNNIEEKPKTPTRNYEIPEEDRVDFAKWLYNLGVQSHYGSNIFDTGSAYLKSLTGFGRTVNPSVGTAQQAIALHLIDRDDIQKRGDNIYHSLGYIPGTDKYKWSYLNGGKETHNKDWNLMQKAARSGQYLLGRFDLTETPTEYVINDNYDFNESGTDYSKQKIDSGEATLYDKLRYLGGQGTNETMPVNLTVSKDDVLNWYNLYKTRNSNNINTEPRAVGFRSVI